MTADRDDLAAMSEAEELATLLAEHTCISGSHQGKDGMWRVHFVCESSDCGWVGPTGDEGRAAHRAHVAQMVLESDWLRGLRAKELRDAADALHYPGNAKATDGIYEKWLRDRADRCRRRGPRQHDRPDVDVQQSETWTGSPKNTKQTK